MNVLKPEIVELINTVEEKYGKKLDTTNDFEAFSSFLYMQIKENISTSTLKRLWGYVNYPHYPRKATLDVLSRFVNFDDYKSFCSHLKLSSVYNSSFFSSDQLLVKNLKEGMQVEIGWAPNRYLRLLYKGDLMFEVIEAQNSKLHEGDCFETTSFMIGHPITLPYILRNGERTQPFIAGRNSGLTLLNVL